MTRPRYISAAAGLGAVALALTACSSSSSSSTESASPATSTAASPAATNTGGTNAGASGSLPTPPAGSTELANTNNNGVTYARYSNAGETPQQVVSFYESAWQSQGYSMSNSGGGGGGYGQYGGSNYGASGSKSGSYVNVQAGGQSSGPTYFEVCIGANQSAVDECENQSNSSSS